MPCYIACSFEQPKKERTQPMKKFGHFDDARKEYVIQSPRTPYPWINYLGTQAFFSLISNTAGGYSFYPSRTLRVQTSLRQNFHPSI